MKKRTPVLVALIALIVVLLVGVGVVLFLGANDDKEAVKTEVSTGTFAEITDVEVFQNIPLVDAKGITFGEAVNYGAGNYIIDANGCDLTGYQGYLEDLVEAGFTKHSDNGEKGMDEYVYTASYTKENLTLTVSYIAKVSKMYVAVCQDLALSDHLIYDASMVANNIADAKTKLHMLELSAEGEAYVIQLKNGHFVIQDGGSAEDAPQLLTYLESLVPEGQKPVIEAWFITVADAAHYGAYAAIASSEVDAARIIVDGVYYTQPGPDMLTYLEETNILQGNNYIVLYTKSFQTQSGETPKLYRPQIGQRYYFSDMYVDVCLSLDQVPKHALTGVDLGETALWLKYQMEEQQFLTGSDAGVANLRTMTMLYDKEFFDVDVMSVLKHGTNVYDFLTDMCTVKTYLYSTKTYAGLFGSEDEPDEVTVALQKSALECLSYGNGTIVMSFPYTAGKYEQMKPLYGGLTAAGGSTGGSDVVTSVSASTAWFDKAASGVGSSEENPYIISSVNDMYGLAKLVSGGTTFAEKYIKIADTVTVLDFNPGWTASATAPTNAWSPIGTSEEKSFQGTFDGNGKTISGIYVSGKQVGDKYSAVGLFAYVQNSVSISNLTLTNSYITNASTFTGAIVGYGEGSLTNLYVTNTVTVSSTSTDDDYNALGGIIGYVKNVADKKGDITKLSVENCWFDGTINSTAKNVGGIIGYNVWGPNTMKHCLFSGTMNVTKQIAGGLVGRANGTVGTITITDCLSAGTIKADASVTSRVGSIMGQGGNSGRTKASLTIDTGVYATNCCAYAVGDSTDTYYADANSKCIVTADITGNNAKTNLPNLDFSKFWTVREGKLPIPTALAGRQ